MNKNYCNQMTIYVLLLFLIEKIISSSDEILNKYSSINTTYNSIIFNISEFKYDENIYLTLKSEGKCVGYIKYQFYDDLISIKNKEPEFKHTIKPYSKTNKSFLGPKKYSYYYIIVKRKDFLSNSNLKGKFINLEFNCADEVEIINEKFGHEDIYLATIFVASLIMLVAFIFIIINEVLYCLFIMMKNSIKNYFTKKKTMNKINDINPTQINKNYPKDRVIYVEVQENMYNQNDSNDATIIYSNQNINNIQMDYQNYPQIQISDYSLTSNTPNSPNQTLIKTIN